jgi:hypothetical protein
VINLSQVTALKILDEAVDIVLDARGESVEMIRLERTVKLPGSQPSCLHAYVNGAYYLVG